MANKNENDVLVYDSSTITRKEFIARTSAFTAAITITTSSPGKKIFKQIKQAAARQC